MDLMTLEMVLVVFGAMILLVTRFFWISAYYGAKLYLLFKDYNKKERRVSRNRKNKPPKK